MVEELNVALELMFEVLLIMVTFIVPLGIVTLVNVKFPTVVAVLPKPIVVLPRVMLPPVIAVLAIAIATLDAAVNLP